MNDDRPEATDQPSPELSVVIPLYNEVDNVRPLVEELRAELDGVGRSYEIVCVDDGSTDRTRAELTAAAAEMPELRVIVFAENAGQTAAFEAGFGAARGRLVITMDGDLQIDPRDISVMLEALEREDVDFVYGWRKDRRDGRLKRISTKIANGIRNRLTNESIPDTGCPLKVFRREVVESFKLFDGMHRFFITLAHIEGFRSAEVVVRHRPRRHGASKYGVWNRIFRALKDCFAVRWMLRRRLRYDAAEVSANPSLTPAVGEAIEQRVTESNRS